MNETLLKLISAYIILKEDYLAYNEIHKLKILAYNNNKNNYSAIQEPEKPRNQLKLEQSLSLLKTKILKECSDLSEVTDIYFTKENFNEK